MKAPPIACDKSKYCWFHRDHSYDTYRGNYAWAQGYEVQVNKLGCVAQRLPFDHSSN